MTYSTILRKVLRFAHEEVVVKTLKDRLADVEMPDRTRRLLMLFPGIMFGFSPPHMEEMIERMDCPICGKILKVVEKQSAILAEIAHAEDEHCAPVRRRNQKRLRRYERLQKIFLLKYFVKLPELEPEPDCTVLPWHKDATQRLNELNTALRAHISEDPIHWADKVQRAISDAYICAELGKDCWMVTE
ncbi:MAG: hypothetical protein WCV84_06010 [Patescibacteria group bacterium]